MKLAAIAVFALVGLAVAQTVRPIPSTEVRLVGQIPAEWWVHVPLVPGQPGFSVPLDMRLVVTDVDADQGDILADGTSCVQQLRAVRMDYPGGHGTRVVFEPGTSLTAPNAARLIWGYLEPVR